MRDLLQRQLRHPDDPPGDGGEGGGDGGGGEGGGAGGEGGGKTVTMSQKALDRLIDDRIGRVANRTREEEAARTVDRLRGLGVASWDELTERLKAPGGGDGDGDDRTKQAVQDALKKQREDHESALAAEKARGDKGFSLAEKLGVRNAVLAAAEHHGAYNAGQVADLMAARFRLDAEHETVEVLTDGGNPAVGADGPLSVEDAVAEFKSGNAHLFRADAKPGSGRGSSGAASDRTHYKSSELQGLSREEKERVLAGMEAGTVTVDPNA